MSKRNNGKKKDGNKHTTEKIVLITVIFELITSLIELINRLIE